MMGPMLAFFGDWLQREVPSPGSPDLCCFGEVDGGRDFHQNEHRERTRDEAIGRAGWHVMHFSGRRIWLDPDECAIEVGVAVRSALL
jgi:hypothetical protein